MRWLSDLPPPNLPRERGRSRDALPARGEGWGGGVKFKSLRKGTYYPLPYPRFFFLKSA
jgi:hypothetical protein